MKSIVTVVAASLAFALAQGSPAPSSLFKADLMEGSDDFFDGDHSDNFFPQPAHLAYAASDNKPIHSAEEFGALGPDTEVLTVDDELMMSLGDINTTVRLPNQRVHLPGHRPS